MSCPASQSNNFGLSTCRDLDSRLLRLQLLGRQRIRASSSGMTHETQAHALSIWSAPSAFAVPALQAAVLFLIFGIRMLQEGLALSSTSDKMAEEIREVEEELASSPSSIPLNDLEEGNAPRSSSPSPGRPRSASDAKGGLSAAGDGLADKAKKMLALVASPVFAQAFVLTFLGEWGDRSQIATIALAAAHVSLYTFLFRTGWCGPGRPFGVSLATADPVFCSDPRLQNLYVIAFGTIIGHGLCTAGAVIGGRWLSTKISVKYSASLALHLSLLASPSTSVR